MRHKLLAAITLTALVAIPAIAEAAEGFSTANVNMRSGPSTQYPAVTMIPVGTPLEINGCLNETPWCDVSFFGGRGWVAGQYIQATYQSRRIYVGPQYYRPLGIPTVTFNLDDYWDRYYRGRDFYHDRDRWRRGPGWGYGRPDANWDRRPYRNQDWNNEQDGNWDRRPDRNRDWGGQQDDNRDWGRQQNNNRDWGRQQPNDNQGWGNQQDQRRDNNRQDSQQRRPQPQPQQPQPQPQPQQTQNNPRPNGGSSGPYSPGHVDPCPADQPNCLMTPRGSNR
ncbi:SH3 domain-containing protein [Rhizobium calliandrae]|uniref:SH3 domain-containing protein n=1 Tax=Rhizobium calliandrae TaxID=1312182 RepID=A0ABT7KJH6_9HYPH|nr:SH3 domain-containing protein [Rhizobium calliandrae]MDL2408794.1 SH3 domain-containing protein [Rhizobium calliandrae]